MLVLTHADVVRLFPMELALEAVRRGAAAYSSGRAEVPPRHHLTIPDGDGSALVMSGYLPGLPALGLKVVSGFLSNEARGLPRASGLMLLLHATNGRPEALLDATFLTAQRSGALTGVACEFLARADAGVLGLIGSGAQARTQLAAVAAVRSIHEARVFSRRAERVEAFVREMSERHPEVAIRAVGSAQEAAEGADIVVAATTASEPVLADEWIRPGMLVCGIGSNRPEQAEIEPATVARAARVVVDTRAGTLERVGDVAGPLAAGLLDKSRVSELGELVLGTAEGRQADDEMIVFKSVGFAAVDLAAAAMIVSAAREQGIGSELDLSGEAGR